MNRAAGNNQGTAAYGDAVIVFLDQPAVFSAGHRQRSVIGDPDLGIVACFIERIFRQIQRMRLAGIDPGRTACVTLHIAKQRQRAVVSLLHPHIRIIQICVFSYDAVCFNHGNIGQNCS